MPASRRHTAPRARRAAARRFDSNLVVPATPADLAYVVHLQKANGEAVGFIPRQALAEKIDLGRVWLASENGEPAGYLHHGSLAVPEVRIFQAAVQYDARRRHLGLVLVADLVARARAAGAAGVSLRCLSFLDANDFWTAAGFQKLTEEPGAKGRLNVWVKRLWGERDQSASSFSFHSRLHPCPRCGVLTTDTWAPGAVRFSLCAACLSGARGRTSQGVMSFERTSRRGRARE